MQTQETSENILPSFISYPTGSAWTFKPTSPRDQQQAPIKSRVFTSSNH